MVQGVPKNAADFVHFNSILHSQSWYRFLMGHPVLRSLSATWVVRNKWSFAFWNCSDIWIEDVGRNICISCWTITKTKNSKDIDWVAGTKPRLKFHTAIIIFIMFVWHTYSITSRLADLGSDWWVVDTSILHTDVADNAAAAAWR